MKADELSISNARAVTLMGRALRQLAPLKKEMGVKILFTLASLVPPLLLPWPGKVIVDQVIGGISVADSPKAYPFFFQPLIALVEGTGPATTALVMFGFLMLLLALVGAWGTTGRDQTFANLSQGMDYATRSENEANFAWSYTGGLLGWLEYRWTLRLTHKLNHSFRSRLFERVQRLPMTALDDQRIGDAVYRVMYDTPGISELCYRLVLTPLVAPIQVLTIAAIMMLVYGDEPIVVWTALAVMPLALVVTFPFSGPIRRLASAARRTGADTTTTMEESSTNILAVQSLGGQARERERFDKDSWESFSQFRRLAVLWISMIALAATSAGGLGIIVFYALTDRVFDGRMTVGDLWVVFAYYAQIVGASTNVGRLWVYLQGRVVAMQRVFDLMDAPSDHQPAAATHLEAVKEGYRFENVSFLYPDGTQALKDVNLEARRGTMVALAGPAGAGKTTLAYMLPRFVSPTSGKIELDGVDLQTIDREDLRKQVAFVFQEPVLFDATVAENIRVGKADATDEELREAAEMAGALEFIRHLPNGFDTPLGRGGGRLSVGQKQRLSIARALVRRAPVLVLDEPTAALDPETEFRLVAALRKAAEDRLVVVIAHRLSTIRHADQILFLRDGQIRERGSHAELMQIEGGDYRRFVELQRGKKAGAVLGGGGTPVPSPAE